jgi:secreted PhoX family phosphatase
MKKFTMLFVSAFSVSLAFSQNAFPMQIDTQWSAKTIWMPRSPFNQSVLFVGGVDTVATTPTYGNPTGKTVAKQWHDFIGVAKDDPNSSEGWVIINHEMTQKNDRIGDGGGMTMFKLRRLPNDQLEISNQTLADGRSGKFFNVDFANTVGETGMNCGGINGGNRIWTAEEWMQSSNLSVSTFLRDTSDFIIGTTTPAGFPGFNGKKLPRYKNLNWMVEIDPKTAKAIRKQYNWGRAGWEGGVLMPDKKTVYLFEDGSPGILAKFEANTAGDFTTGKLYVYKQDAPTKWIEIENNLDTLSELNAVALRRGASMFNRLEWGAYFNGRIYITETGRDALNYNSGNALRGVVSQGLIDGYKYRFKLINGRPFGGTDAQAADSVRLGRFADYYGRVLEFDPISNSIRSYIEGGPYWIQSGSQNRFAYPAIHLSNPDGLDFMKIGKKNYMIIQEDLNGSSWNRMPAGITQTICETFLLDMDISNPSFKDLIRITACAPGAEVTGATMFDNRTMLLNSQHPSTSNLFPYNNSLTYAITGFQDIATLAIKNAEKQESGFSIFPNPAARQIQLSEAMDIAIYNASGQRVKVARNAEIIDISDLNSGIYFVRNNKGETVRLVVQ